MTDVPPELDIREQIVRIDQMIAETQKYTAEQHKLLAEASKFRMERWLSPIIIVAGAIGTFIGSSAALAAFWHFMLGNT